MFSCIVGCCGKADQFLHQFILKLGGFGLFAADTGVDTAFIACGLLALKTKHIRHGYSSNRCNILFLGTLKQFFQFLGEVYGNGNKLLDIVL